MASKSQILANRLNAQKSTGPKTTQGKALVSQNALKHGLAARHDVITSESQADFDLHREALLDELDPQGPMESMLAERIVSLSWRLKRADLIQNQTIDAMHENNESNPLAKLAKSFGLKGLTIPQPEPTDSNPDLTLGRIALKDFSNARVLDRLLMYERRIEHSLFKTTLELQRLHLLRNLNPPDQISNSNQPEPAPPPNPNLLICNPAHRQTPIRPEAIINNQSSIVNIKNPPAPPFSHRRHDDALIPSSTPRPQARPEQPRRNDIRHPTHNIRLPRGGNTQNKPNPQNPKITTTPCISKTYPSIPAPLHPKKQTQSNPISGLPKLPVSPAFRTHLLQSEHDIRHTIYDIRNKTQSNPIPPCTRRHTKYEIQTRPVAAKPLAKPDQRFIAIPRSCRYSLI